MLLSHGKPLIYEGFVFTNYQNLNNGNLLLESDEILKQKWHKMKKMAC